MLDTLTEELLREAFYKGRVVKRYDDRGNAIFAEPTFEGWLRNPETIKEISRLTKLYAEKSVQCTKRKPK